MINEVLHIASTLKKPKSKIVVAIGDDIFVQKPKITVPIKMKEKMCPYCPEEQEYTFNTICESKRPKKKDKYPPGLLYKVDRFLERQIRCEPK